MSGHDSPGWWRGLLAGGSSHAGSEPARNRPLARSTRVGDASCRVAEDVRGDRAMPIATPDKYAEMLDAAKSQVVRVPRHQRLVLADAQRRARRVRRGRQRRDHPGLDRRCGVPLRPDDQEHGDRIGRVRDVRPRGGQELPRQHRAAHRPLPQGQARRLRPAAARDLHRAGQERPAPALPVAHVGRVRRTPRREPADRPGAAQEGGRGEHRARGRDRCRRRRGGRRRGRRGRAALQHHRGRHRHRRGARRRRERSLHDRADLRQRARRLQAGQRQAAPGDPAEGPAGGRREARARTPTPSPSTWSSTVAPARPRRRSQRRSTSA